LSEREILARQQVTEPNYKIDMREIAERYALTPQIESFAAESAKRKEEMLI